MYYSEKFNVFFINLNLYSITDEIQNKVVLVAKVNLATMTETEQQYVETKITVPWGHVAAITYGPSTGKPVLMVHGFLDNAGSFIRLMEYLPLGHYYIAIDLPGHGRSSHFPSWMTLDFVDYVNVLHYILEALQWKTCIYIGHSMGAQIGITFSTLQPLRFEKIICFDGFNPPILTSEDFLKNFKDIFWFTTKALNNNESKLYSKEEVLYALQYRRFATLNSNAADAMFERAITKVNGKYRYNRDIRLKRDTLSSLNLENVVSIIGEITIPIYLFLATHNKQHSIDYFDIHKKIKLINPRIQLKIIYIDGNHDFHNNNPEKVAPFVCKILNSDLLCKL